MDRERRLISDWFNAIERSQLNTLQKLKSDIHNIDLRARWSINGVDHKNVTGLIVSAHVGNKDVVRWFIDNRADVNAKTQSGWTPLHFASKRGHVSTVDMLCQAGAVLDARTQLDETPLRLAIQAHMRDTVRKLLNNEAVLDFDEAFLLRYVQRGVLPQDVLEEIRPRRHRGIPSGVGGLVSTSVSTTSSSNVSSSTGPVCNGGVPAVVYTAYDYELAKGKREVLSKLNSALSSAAGGSSDDAAIVRLIRRMTYTETSLDQRSRFAQEALDLVTGNSDRSWSPPPTRIVEGLIRMMELTMCESHCPSCIYAAASRLTVELLRSCRKEAGVSDYVVRLLRKVVERVEEQYRYGMLGHLLAIFTGADAVLKTAMTANVELMMASLWNLIESLDQVNNVAPMARVWAQFGQLFPDYMSGQFVEVVDILVGWCVDLQTETTVITAVLQVLSRLTPFWLEHEETTRPLLHNLIEDADRNARQRLPQGKSGGEESYVKVQLFVGVFSSIMTAVSPNLEMQQDKFVELVLRLVEAVTIVCRRGGGQQPAMSHSRLLETANRGLLALLAYGDSFRSLTGTSVVGRVASFVCQQGSWVSGQCPSTGYILSFLQVVETWLDCDEEGCKREDFLSHILGPNSLIHSVKCSRNSTVIASILGLIARVLRIGSAPVIKIVHRLVLTDLDLCFRYLMDPAGGRTGKDYSSTDAEALALFNLMLLSLLACPDEAVVDVPSPESLVLPFLGSNTPLTDPRLIAAFPRVHFALLALVETVTKKVVTLELVTKLVVALCMVLRSRQLTLSGQELVLRMLDHLLSSEEVGDMGGPLLKLTASTLCKFLTRDQQCSVCETGAVLIRRILRQINGSSSDRLLESTVRLAVVRLSHWSPKVARAYMDLLLSLPFGQYFQVLSRSSQLFKSGDSTLTSQWSTIQQLMTSSTSNSVNFCGNNMTDVFNAIVLGTSPPLTDWLRRLHLITSSFDVGSAASTPWIYSLWQAASHCINKKLKVEPWFKPQETFLALEGVLKSILLSCHQHPNDQHQVHPPRHTTITAAPTGHNATSPDHFSQMPWSGKLQQALMLVNFLDTLEKMTLATSEGSTVLLQPPRQVRTFFQTNRETCLVWFSRIRLLAMRLAESAGQPAVVVRQGMVLLQQVQESEESGASGCSRQGISSSAEVEEVLVLISRALKRLGSWEVLEGLHKWSSTRYGRRFGWLRAMSQLTNGQIESSMKQLEEFVLWRSRGGDEHSPVEGPGHLEGALEKKKGPIQVLTKSTSMAVTAAATPAGHVTVTGLQLCCQEYAACCLQLGNYDELAAWTARCHQLGGDVAKLEMTGRRAGYLSQLTQWDHTLPAHNTDGAAEQWRHEWRPHRLAQLLNDRMTQLTEWTAAGHNTADEVGRLIEVALETGRLVAAGSGWPAGGGCQLSIPELHLVVEKGRLLTLDSGDYGSDGDLVMLDCLAYRRWLEQLGLTDWAPRTEAVLNCVRWSRRHGNQQLAAGLCRTELCRLLGGSPTGDLAGLVHQFYAVNNGSGLLAPLPHLRLESETAKVLWANGSASGEESGLELLTSALRRGVLTETGDSQLHTAKCHLNAKLMLTLFKWLTDRPQLTARVCAAATVVSSTGQDSHPFDAMSRIAANLSLFSKLADTPWTNGVPLLAPPSADESMPQSVAVPATPAPHLDPGSVTGRLLMVASRLSPPTAQGADTKSWFTMANWCYDRADGGSNSQNKSLTTEEMAELAAMLNQQFTETEVSAVVTAVNQSCCSCVESGDTEQIGTSPISKIERLCEDDEEQLVASLFTHLHSALPTHFPSPSSIRGSMVQLVRRVVLRRYTLFISAARAYFTFLTVAAGPASSMGSAMQDVITASLRLLSLLRQPCRELRQLVCTQLEDSPRAWLGIVPQLFARLHHPDPPVRAAMVRLIAALAGTGRGPMMLADGAHLVVFPVIVGCPASSLGEYSRRTSHDQIEAVAGVTQHLPGSGTTPTTAASVKVVSPSAEEAKSVVNPSAVESGYLEIREALFQKDGRLVREMEVLVDELRRITLLWDELWLGALGQHMEEMQKKVCALENEQARTLAHATLTEEKREAIISAKYTAYLRPTVAILERLQEVTIGYSSTGPETPHEIWFRENFGQLIKDTLESIRSPASPSEPQSSWQAVRHLQQFMQQRCTALHHQQHRQLVQAAGHQQQSGTSGQAAKFCLAHISPRLAKLSSTCIPMPGREDIHVHCLQNSVHILSTKTKPKKLFLRGSNGISYPYLFKGLEDLHLDERVMQFQAVVNPMFTKINRQARPRYTARLYTVTPLGPRSGLIQMVEGATPLFTIYKNWQQQQQQDSLSTHIPRPSELFFAKLKPLLDSRGIKFNSDERKDVENRSAWPLAVLREVFTELQRETPPWLLSRELWYASATASDWWSISQVFARSAAFMSMLGYVLGLGDRHLDNVMVDLATGEVVHIDYNICFDKGRYLKVPEKVPFRLTQIVQNALGVAGVEGMFRVSCETAMTTLRAGRNSLLTLLEAFIYDPLVDWQAGLEAGYLGAYYSGRPRPWLQQETSFLHRRRQLEREVNQVLLGVRAVELHDSWAGHKTRMDTALREIEQRLAIVETCSKEESRLRARRDLLTLVKAYLDDPTNGTTLADLLQRHERYRSITEGRQAAINEMEALMGKVQADCTKQRTALEHLSDDFIVPLVNQVKTNAPLTALSQVIKDFLINAGKANITTDYDAAVQQLESCLSERHAAVTNCLHVLNSYKSVISFYPTSYGDSDRDGSLFKLLAPLIQEPTAAGCDEAIKNYMALWTSRVVSQSQLAAVVGVENSLETLIDKIQHEMTAKLTDRPVYPTTDTSAEMHRLYIFLQDQTVPSNAMFKLAMTEFLHDVCKESLELDTLLFNNSLSISTYLDDQYEIVSSASQLLATFTNQSGHVLLVSTESVPASDYIRLIAVIDTTLKSIRHFRDTFDGVILPEAIRIISSADEVTDSLIDSLTTLSDMVQPVVNMWTTVVENAQTPVSYDGLKPLFNQMRAELKNLLLQDVSPSSARMPCMMLLRSFYQSILELCRDVNVLLQTLHSHVIPDVWYYVDLVSTASSHLSPCWNRGDHLAADALFCRAVQAMVEVCRGCQRSAVTFRDLTGGPISTVCNELDLGSPVRDLLIGMISQHLIAGLPSLALAQAFCLLLEDSQVCVRAVVVENGMYGSSDVTLVGTYLYQSLFDMMPPPLMVHVYPTGKHLVTGVRTAIASEVKRAAYETSIARLQVHGQRARCSLASFQWLHEDLLFSPTVTALRPIGTLSEPTRSSVLGELGRCADTLVSLDENVVEIEERVIQLEMDMELRLRWGQAARPELADLIAGLRTNREARVVRLDKGATVASQVASMAANIVHFENRRTSTTEAITFDTEVLSVLNQTRAALLEAEQNCQLLTEMETRVMQVNEEEEKTTTSTTETAPPWWQPLPIHLSQSESESCTPWWGPLATHLSQEIPLVETALCEQANRLTSLVTGLDSAGQLVRGALTSAGYRESLTELKPLLKVLARIEDEEGAPTEGEHQYGRYLQGVRRWSELMHGLARGLTGSVPVGRVAQLLADCRELRDVLLVAVFDGLAEVAPGLQASAKGESQQQKVATGAETKAPPNHQSTTNQQAITVWRRVRDKLSGVDPHLQSRPEVSGQEEGKSAVAMSVSDQVDACLRAATSADNLALMYEGWTAWV